jgi:plastocyanin
MKAADGGVTVKRERGRALQDPSAFTVRAREVPMKRRLIRREVLPLLCLSGLLYMGLGGCGSSNDNPDFPGNTTGGTTTGGTTSGTTGGATTGTTGGTVTVLMEDDPHHFAPRDVQVSPGAVVVWTNVDEEEPHTVTSDPGTTPGGPNSDTQFPNGLGHDLSYNWTVPSGAVSGTKWFYHCRFHGSPGNGTTLGAGMAGSVTVK